MQRLIVCPCVCVCVCLCKSVCQVVLPFLPLFIYNATSWQSTLLPCNIQLLPCWTTFCILPFSGGAAFDVQRNLQESTEGFSVAVHAVFTEQSPAKKGLCIDFNLTFPCCNCPCDFSHLLLPLSLLLLFLPLLLLPPFLFLCLFCARIFRVYLLHMFLLNSLCGAACADRCDINIYAVEYCQHQR